MGVQRLGRCASILKLPSLGFAFFITKVPRYLLNNRLFFGVFFLKNSIS